MSGGFDAKPGGGSLVQSGQTGGAAAAPGKRTLTEQVHGPAAQAPARVRVNARGLNVRKGPTTDANIVGGLRRGDTVDVIDRDGKWLVVVHGGANAFMRKPLGMDRLVEAATAIRDFWLRTATLPSEP